MQKTNNSPQEIWNTIINAKRLLSIIDARFDLDSFGSNFALKNVLNSLGKEIDLIYSQSAKEEAKKYFDISVIKQNVKLTKFDFTPYDVIIVLDSAGIYHLNPQFEDIKFPETSKLINIDHHTTNDFYGQLNYVFRRASTSSLLFEIFNANNVKIDKSTSEMLLMGLLTDSGFLQYDSIQPADFHVVAKLIEAGADYFKVVWNLTYNEPYENIKFKSYVYSNFVLDKEKRYGYLVTTNEDYEKNKIERGKVTVTAADLVRRVEDVDFVFTLSQDAESKNKYWISFRARVQSINVLVFAENIGRGGGHVMASGSQIDGFENSEDALNFVKQKIEELREQSMQKD